MPRLRGAPGPALFIAVMFFDGALRAPLGVLGAYAGRVHAETKRRPPCFIGERTGFPPPAFRAGR